MSFFRDEVIRLYTEDRLTQKQIAEAVGSHQTVVSKILRDSGIECRDSRHLDWPVKEMIQWYISGETIESIARKLGRNPKATWKVLKKNGCPMRRSGPQSGALHAGWKGGKIVDKTGYILVHRPDHPYANNAGYVREHRLVAEQVLGRHLTRNEVVHHKNGDHADNDPENLQVFDSNADHLRHELTGRIPKWTEEGYARMCSPRRRRTSIPGSSESDETGSNGTSNHSTG